jgi:glycosyltransferase involved in cell wall biosynthesis
MRTSLVIPTYNQRDHLLACLLSLNHQRVTAGHEFEVIVADDGSSDGTVEIVQAPHYDYPVRHVYRPRDADSSRPRARNLGVAAAEGDVIIFVDGDQVIPPGFVDAHLRVHEYRDDLVVLGPRSAFGAGAIDVDRLRRGFTADSFPPVRRHDVRHEVFAEFSYNINTLATRWHLAFTCNLSVRREHLSAVGGFDTDFLGWGLEDSELAYRLDRHGLTFVFAERTLLFHPRVPGSSAADRCAGWRANLSHFLTKHQDPEVSVLQLFRQFYSGRPEMTWTEAFRRSERAVRALRGWPEADAPRMTVTVTDNLAEVTGKLERNEYHGDLDIIDATGDERLAIVAQCSDTGGRLRFFTPAGDRYAAGRTI